MARVIQQTHENASKLAHDVELKFAHVQNAFNQEIKLIRAELQAEIADRKGEAVTWNSQNARTVDQFKGW